MDTTPVSLLLRLKQKNQPHDWRRFVSLYTPILLLWSRKLGLQEADAADLVQDAFVTLFEKLPAFTYDRSRSFRAWLWTVVKNKHNEGLRRRNKLHAVGGPAPEPLLPDPTESYSESEYQQYVACRIMQLMKTDFQPTTWNACWETVVNGKTPAAVAVELGISLKAVYLARTRVLKRLRQELEGLME